VGGNIEIPRHVRVDGDVQAIGGNADIKGWVTGDAVCIGGNVVIREGGIVDGDAVVVIGGNIRREPGSQVKGDEVHLSGLPGNVIARMVERVQLPPTARHGPPHRPMGFFGSLLLGAFVSLLAVLLFPKRMAVMAKALPARPGHSAVIGVVGLLFAPPAALAFLLLGVIVAVIALVTIIGPLVVLGAMAAAYLLTFLLAVMGCAAVWLSLGRMTLDKLGHPQAHAVAAAMVGLLIVAAASALPGVGPLVTITVAVFGLGLVATTGAGTSEDWLSEKWERFRRHGSAADDDQPAKPEPRRTRRRHHPTRILRRNHRLRMRERESDLRSGVKKRRARLSWPRPSGVRRESTRYR